MILQKAASPAACGPRMAAIPSNEPAAWAKARFIPTACLFLVCALPAPVAAETAPEAAANNARVWVVLEPVEGPAMPVELVGFEAGRYELRTLQGVTFEKPEEQVRGIRIVQVGGEPPWRPDSVPQPLPEYTLKSDEKMWRYVRAHFGRAMVSRVARLAAEKREGRLDQREQRTLLALRQARDIDNALALTSELLAIQLVEPMPMEEAVEIVRNAAMAIEDEAVRREVLDALHFLAKRLQFLKDVLRQAGEHPRERPGFLKPPLRPPVRGPERGRREGREADNPH